MIELTQILTNSNLWKKPLDSSAGSDYQDQRARLRSSFISFRERAAQLADEIRKDLPDLTVHDITHLDALWEIASQITGDEFLLTPTEGYVLGGAILLHDLAMSVAATPGGFEKIKEDKRYKDLLFSRYQEKHERSPTEQEQENPASDIKKYVLFCFLRISHAENAEHLATISYQSKGKTPIFLIDDTELRQTFGKVIGRIAHSHWWSIEKLEKEFSRTIGAPAWAPGDWIIDPMKIACILRTADASHLDARRAPTFVRAFSKLNPSSEEHWIFQEKLSKPYLKDDALVFTSGEEFPLAEAGAWWLCLDALRMVDQELRSVDALLSDKSLKRFKARRVAGVDLPERLTEYIRTKDWLPINATVHISDLPSIIKSVGGEELYGKNPIVPLRELIQNAADAIRARSLYEHRKPSFGKIRVSLLEEDDSFFLEVEDNGVGMSKRVLTEFLLDFGKSFWSSSQVQEEFPGLLSSGFKSTGKYGIGFFSVFMAADNVKIVTRRSDAAANDTLVLEFGSGLHARPILRPAKPEEQSLDGGTIIRLQLKCKPSEKGGLLHSHKKEEDIGLFDVCQQVAPALDTTLVVFDGAEEKICINTNDWETIPGYDLLKRFKIRDHDCSFTKENKDEFLENASQNLRNITDDNGKIVGRICISLGFNSFRTGTPDLCGAVTVGGLLASSLSGICGVLVGNPTRASRDAAIPVVSKEALAKWAEEQTGLIPNLFLTQEKQASCAEHVRTCGGNTGKLPIAINIEKWVSIEDIAGRELPEMIVIIDHFLIEYQLKQLTDYVLDNHVFVTSSHGLSTILPLSGYRSWPENIYKNHKEYTLNTLAGAIVEAAAISWKVSVEDIITCNSMNREVDVKIGMHNGKDIKVSGLVVNKPRK
jgi:hypothetical protein